MLGGGGLKPGFFYAIVKMVISAVVLSVSRQNTAVLSRGGERVAKFFSVPLRDSFFPRLFLGGVLQLCFAWRTFLVKIFSEAVPGGGS